MNQNSHHSSRKNTALLLKNEKGLTLVEVIAVIILLGLIGSVVMKGVFGTASQAKAQTNMILMEKVKSAIGQYRLQYNSYPSSLQNLVTASSEVKESGQLFTPLLTEKDLKDVWGNPLVYKTENGGRSYALTTFGEDGVAGGEGAKQDVTLRP
jgi:general secretion pathway protein G